MLFFEICCYTIDICRFVIRHYAINRSSFYVMIGGATQKKTVKKLIIQDTGTIKLKIDKTIENKNENTLWARNIETESYSSNMVFQIKFTRCKNLKT